MVLGRHFWNNGAVCEICLSNNEGIIQCREKKNWPSRFVGEFVCNKVGLICCVERSDRNVCSLVGS